MLYCVGTAALGCPSSEARWVLFLARLTGLVKSCHPDRSISFPKGMRCEVEGPAVSLHAKN